MNSHFRRGLDAFLILFSQSRRAITMLAVIALLVAPQSQADTTPTTDFTDNNDGTVTHRTTGLTWMRCAQGQAWTSTACSGAASAYTWDQANALTNALHFAGHSDWRLPTIAEFQTIVNRDAFNPAANTAVFSDVTSVFWSATPYAPTFNWIPGHARRWGVNFSNGDSNYYDLTNAFAVRLLRGGVPPDSSGNFTPTTDFTDNNDGTVTHLKTGLTWMRCPRGQTSTGTTCGGFPDEYSWYETLRRLNNFTFAGHSDWRLPTAAELLTIVEYRNLGFAVNNAVFPQWGDGSSRFWSSSTYAGSGDYAWYVNFFYGSDFPGDTGERLAARYVRGGQSLPGAQPITSTGSDSDRIFTWAEIAFPHYFPRGPATQDIQGYTARYYPSTGIYLGTKDGRVFIHDGISLILHEAGLMSDALLLAQRAGF